MIEKGFVRYMVNNDIFSVADEKNNTNVVGKDVSIVVDRLVKKEDENFVQRLGDSLSLAQEK